MRVVTVYRVDIFAIACRWTKEGGDEILLWTIAVILIVSGFLDWSLRTRWADSFTFSWSSRSWCPDQCHSRPEAL